MNNNDFAANMDELQAEHEAAKAAKADAEREASRQAYLKREEEARKARNLLRTPILEKIALRIAPPHSSTVNAEDAKLFIDEIDVTYYIDFVEEHTRLSSWRSKPNGKTRLTIGSYGNRVSFPQRKDGSHNYEEVARLLSNIVDRKKAAEKIDAQRRANSQGLGALKAELFPNDKNGYCDVISASASPAAPVLFKFDIKHSMTADKARALAKALRDVGIKLHYSDDK